MTVLLILIPTTYVADQSQQNAQYVFGRKLFEYQSQIPYFNILFLYQYDLIN